MAIGYVLQAVKLACPAVLVGLLAGAWLGPLIGVFVGVLVYWLLLSVFVGEKVGSGGV